MVMINNQLASFTNQRLDSISSARYVPSERDTQLSQLLNTNTCLQELINPEFNAMNNTDLPLYKETEHFQSLPRFLRENSKTVAELLQRGEILPKVGMIELDADEYDEVKIVVYLKQRLEPREEIRLLRKMLKEVRGNFPEDKIHIVIDYLDRTPEI
ncbi:hypothetical protein DRN44_08775 [Thermococci archaeon]|nr:MAG: hypothetical protein DRN44_08775 [Thermococci archaeon]